MNAPVQVNELRPLGIGEILDRAVNLCVRSFGVLALINVVFIVPAAIVQFQAQKNLQLIVGALTSASRGSNSGAEVFKALSNSPQPSVWLFLGYIAIMLLNLLTSAALVDAISNLYLARGATFGASYGVAVRRWGPLLGLFLLYLFAGIALYFAITLALVAVGLAIGLLYSFQAILGVVVGIVIGLILFAILVAVLTVLLLAWEVSVAAIVVEKMNFAVGFTRGLGRVLARPMLGRSMLAGFAFLAVLVGISLIDVMGEALIVGVTKNAYVGVVFASAIRIVTAAFTTAFAVIFYYDLRVREEGLDLTMAS